MKKNISAVKNKAKAVSKRFFVDSATVRVIGEIATKFVESTVSNPLIRIALIAAIAGLSQLAASDSKPNQEIAKHQTQTNQTGK